MARKLARQIGCLLLANNTITPFCANRAVEVIDRAIQGKTITKKEVERFQESDRILKVIETEQYFFFDRTIADLKSKLWDAEQEVHDLKYELEKQRDNATEQLKLNDEYLQSLRRELDHLYYEFARVQTENANLTQLLIVQFVNEVQREYDVPIRSA